MRTDTSDYDVLDDRTVRESLSRAARAAAGPAGRNADLALQTAMVAMTRQHAGDLRALRAIVDHALREIGPARLDEAALAVAAGTLDVEVAFDIRDTRRGEQWDFENPYGAFVAHVLLHRNRIQNDPVSMSQTCARIVSAHSRDAVAPWSAVAAAALSHPDAVVAAAAASVEVHRSGELMAWRVMYARVAAGHRDDPLLTAAIEFLGDAMAARCDSPERAEFLTRVCTDIDAERGEASAATRRQRTAADGHLAPQR